MSVWIILDRWRWTLPLLVVAGGGLAWWVWHRIPPPLPAQASELEAPTLVWPEPTRFAPDAFAVLRTATAPTQQAGLVQRYRLAGTFVSVGQEAASRIAFVERKRDGEQFTVMESESFDGGVMVRRVYPDRVELVEGTLSEVLWRTADEAAPVGSRIKDPLAQQEAPRTWEDTVALETNRFGKRIGERKWVYQREALLAYQEELMEDPERLANLYLSFSTDKRGEENAGFLVDPKGEFAFFEMIGLQAGDSIRRVNSMKMSSQRRAEIFLQEFGRDRLDALVLDVERNGEIQQHIFVLQR